MPSPDWVGRVARLRSPGMETSLVTQIPLATVLVWTVIGISTTRGGSLKVSTGVAFTATAFLMALYALWDWLSLAFGMGATPGPLLPPSHLFLVMASLTFFYFGKWLVLGRRWLDLLFAIPVLLMGLHFLMLAFPATAAPWTATEVFPEFATAALTHYLIYTLALIVTGIYFLHHGALLTRDVMSREAWAIIGIMSAATLALAFAILTNPYFPFLQENVTPLYSATLVVPGIFLLLALRKGRGVGVLQLFNVRQASQGETLAVYLIHETGDLLGAALAEDQGVDEDLFVATLDAFQRFFTTALPFFQGHTLKTASFGEISVIIEQGEYCYLTVVTTSKRLGLWRELMRQHLRAFEGRNRRQLRDWSGVLDVLHGTEEVVGGFIPEDVEETPLTPPMEAVSEGEVLF